MDAAPDAAPDATTWQPIDSAPKNTEILVYTKPWGTIIASFSEEFGEWLSRMQMPVSIRDDQELPTHWRPLPDPPGGAAATEEPGPGGTAA